MYLSKLNINMSIFHQSSQRLGYLLLALNLIVVYTSLTNAISADHPCYDVSWIYSKLSGKCYFIAPAKANWTNANSFCSSQLSSFSEMANKVSLGIFVSINDAKAISSVLATVSNYEVQWSAGKLDTPSNKYYWTDGSLVDPDSDLMSPTMGSQECLIFTHLVQNPEGDWIAAQVISSINCSTEMAYYCEHQAVRCETPNNSNLKGFNMSTMVLSPNTTTVQSQIEVVCQPGFYQYSKLSYATTISPGAATATSKANCTGVRSTDGNPALYVAQWKSSFDSLEICLPVTCSVLNGSLVNVDSQPATGASGAAVFEYGYEFKVNCSMGYVNYQDTTSITSSMTCGQSQEDLGLGVWEPQDYNACIAVRCNKTEMESMVPQDGALYQAINSIQRQLKYKDFEINQFNQYNNIVYIKCPTGYFFPDRSFNKQIICGLQEASRIKGEWKEYQGTVFPIASVCKPVVCSYETVLWTDNLNMEMSFMVTYPNGTTFNRTSANGQDYPYNVQLQFFCLDNYETTTQDHDVNLTCSETGLWSPRLAPCIPSTSTLLTGNSKHYIPAASEAESAEEVGALVIIILVVFLVLIIILDLSTIARDIKIMSNNLKHVKRRIQGKKTL